MAENDVDSPSETPEELPEAAVPQDPPADDTPAEPETPAPGQKPEAVMMERIEGMSKSVQRLSQEVAQLNKKAAKGDLSEVDEAKRRQAEQDASRIQNELEALAKQDGDEDLAQKLTKSQVAAAKRIEALEKKLERLSKPSPENEWTRIQEQHPGVDVKAVWKDADTAAGKSQAVINAAALQDAGVISQEAYAEIYRGVASDIFNAKVSSAPRKKLPTASAPPPSPPNGGRAVPMRGGQSPAPAPQLDDPYMAAVMAASQAMDKAR